MRSPVSPPATIGILGGGQLGRMTALAARSLGYRVRVLDPRADCAAAPIADAVIQGSFADADAARRLAAGCDVVTLEIEQVSLAALNAAGELAPVRPGSGVLGIVQDRARQKRWLGDIGLPLGEYAVVSSADDLRLAMQTIGPDLFVQACEGGFDGRSQLRLAKGDDASAAHAALGGARAVAERALDLELELSILVARRPSGQMVVFPPALNHHERQILAWSALPGAIDPAVLAQAVAMARSIAEEIGLEGILAIELFLLRDGRLLVNELAPRPHNSFHATELACPTSQFEQLVRAVCDLPLGDVEPVRPSAIVNLLGELWSDGREPDYARALAVPGTRLFLYDKHGPTPGRKMGHLAASGTSSDEALQRVQLAFSRL